MSQADAMITDPPNEPEPDPAPSAAAAGSATGRSSSPRIVSRIGPPRTRIETAEVEARSPGSLDLDDDPPHRATSQALAVAAALALHVALVLVAFLVVLFPPRRSPAVITVDSSAVADPAPARPVIVPPSARRPSAAGKPVAALTAPVSAPDFLPAFDDLEVEPMDLGLSSTLPDLGFAPPGYGGARFLGLSAGRGVQRVTLLIDVSGSMHSNCGPEGLDAIRREVRTTVNALAGDVHFNIFTFASDADGFSERSVLATPERKAAAIEFYDAYFRPGAGFYETRTSEFGKKGEDEKGVRYFPVLPNQFRELRGYDGSTRVELGIMAAMQSRPQVIFVISDGEPMTSREGRQVGDDTLLELIDTEYQRLYRSPGMLRINTISVEGQGARFLKKVARHFGGRYKSISPAEL